MACRQTIELGLLLVSRPLWSRWQWLLSTAHQSLEHDVGWYAPSFVLSAVSLCLVSPWFSNADKP